MDGVVLGVDGQEGDVVFARGFQNQFAGGDETFFVGEANGFAGADGSISSFKSGDANDGGDDEIHFRLCGDVDGSGGAEDDLGSCVSCLAEALGEGSGQLFRRHGHDLRAPADALGEGFVEIVAGGEGDDLVAVGKGLADGEGALPDRTGRAKDGELLHSAIFSDGGVRDGDQSRVALTR